METAVTRELPQPELRATLSIEAASSRIWDVVVAGAGPAGALVAHGLAWRGVSVLLVDRAAYPRAKVCGSCLNGGAMAAMRAAGLGDLPRQFGATPLHELRLRAGGREASLKLPAGVSLSRRTLDAALIEAAVRVGVEFLPETEAVLSPQQTDLRSVRLRQASRRSIARARAVVAVDGLSGSFLREFADMRPVVSQHAPIGVGAVFDNAPEFYQPGAVFMSCAREGYVGAVRMEDGRLDVTAAINPHEVRGRGRMAASVAAILSGNGLPCPDELPGAAFRGTPPLTRRRGYVAAEGLFVLGDVAGYIEPMTGEGISWAMQQAVMLVPLLHESLPRPSFEHAYLWQCKYERFVHDRRSVCLAAAWIRRHPRLAVAVVALLGRLPILAAPWVRAVNRPVAELQSEPRR
jgi:flavin-dependent dehydrogenase